MIINENNELWLKGRFVKNNTKELKLIEILKLRKIKYLRLGLDFLFILTNDNTLYGFGNDNKAALGINGLGTIEEDSDIEENEEINKIDYWTKFLYNDWIEISYKVKDISCSDNHSILLDLNGNITTTGSNACGQLGLGDEKERKKFTKVNLNFKVIKIIADNATSFIVNENNELFGCGYNVTGQLGIGNNETINMNVFTRINFNNCQTKNFQIAKESLFI